VAAVKLAEPWRDELAALLELRLLVADDDLRLAALLERYGTARQALRAPAADLGPGAARRGDAVVAARVRRGVETIVAQGVRVLRLGRPGYPRRLTQLTDPPPVLFVRGRLELLRRRCVALVGARRHTAYGAEATELLADGLSARGEIIVSGLARGIDGIAHRAALRGGTIAVLGSGIDVPYPREHAALFERIAADGLLVSEFPPGEPAFKQNFPRRNRIIAALAQGVVVVEATERSGSLITADHALDLGRDLLAVPGPIGRPTSVGTNDLLKTGAELACCAQDVIDAMKPGAQPGRFDKPEPDPEPRPARRSARARRRIRRGSAAVAGAGGTGDLFASGGPSGLPDATVQVWRALAEGEARHVDEIARVTGHPPATALTALLELELVGLARKLPGMQYAAC
jgi:DNA processing protein